MTARGGRRQRVAIVGGGIAGVSLAWLLDGECDVVLFEKNPRLGGHAHTVEVDYRGQAIAVDLGAQLFGPKVHPTYLKLLEAIGVHDPARPEMSGSIACEMGTTLIDLGTWYPRFVSPMWSQRRLWPLWTRWNFAGQTAFLLFALHAARFEVAGDWSITLDAWLRSLRGLTDEHREKILLPWLSALSGCSIEEARGFSARAAIACPARALPKNPIEPSRWTHLRIGLGGVVDKLAASCSSLVAHLGSPVAAIERTGRGYGVLSTDGRREEVDQIVLASPPHATRALLEALPGCERAAELMGRFRYFRTRMAIHTDPLYVHGDRRMWSAYNTMTSGGRCEGSIWYGALREPLADGTTLDLFKSWVTARRDEPREVLCEAEYLHPLIDPEFVHTQERLAEHQGAGGLWFAGSYTHDVDLQETALVSALRVAQRIAPRAKNLRALTLGAHDITGAIAFRTEVKPTRTAA